VTLEGERRACFAILKWFFFGYGEEFRNFPLKLGNAINTSAWKSSILRKVDKGAEQESTRRGRLRSFSSLKMHVVGVIRQTFSNILQKHSPSILTIPLHVMKQLAERIILIKHWLLASLILGQERGSEEQILLKNLSPIFPWNCTSMVFKGLCIEQCKSSF